MSITYVNDLRLSEMSTGSNSGTWGNVTNTNLELIGDALGYGTEAITTNADTHSSTIADGTADAARAMYIKYTGTLDSACTITIGPNTISRVHIIENATSGSQNIIIKQGSGATVTIGSGAVKMVYLDGAGSGAAVTDALVDLDLTGTTTLSSLVIGHNDANDGSVSSAFSLQNIGTDYNSSSIGLARFSADVNAPTVAFHKSRNASIGGDTVVADNDELGRIRFFGNDGTDFAEGARITALVNGTPGSGDMPSELVFSTSADGAESPTARLTIDSSGNVGIGETSPQQNLHVSANNPGGKIRLEMGQSGVADGDVTGEIQFYHNDSSGAGVNADIKGICTSSVGAGALTFGTGTTSTTEQVRIEGSKVGIGATAPGYDLEVRSNDTSTEPQVVVRNLGTGDAAIGFQIASANNYYIGVDNSESDNLILGRGLTVGTNPALVVDTSSNVGVGTGTASIAAKFVVQDSSLPKIESNYNNAKHLDIGNGASGCGFAMTTGHFMTFNHQPFADRGTDTNLTERIRLDSSGNLLVGKTSSATNTVGIEIDGANGVGVFTRDSNAPIEANLKTNDGTIINLRKDGSTVGRIASENGYLRIEGGDGSSIGSGLLYTNTVIAPRSHTGASTDGTIDLGYSTERFKDAHFSGIVDCAEITYDKVNNSAGNSGLNVNAQYSYDDDNENSIGSNFHNNHTFIYINTNAGFTVVPVLSNGGAGIAWANYLWDPDGQSWGSVNDMTFTQAGTSGNTFRIRISAGQGTGTIERTSGSMAYQVYVSRPAGGS